MTDKLTIQCAYCGAIKDKDGIYDGVKRKIIRVGNVSHGVCPPCYKKVVAEIEEREITA